jgi:hypothetical protein
MKLNTLQTLKEIEDGIVEIRNIVFEGQMLNGQDTVDTKLHMLEMKTANLRAMINIKGDDNG